MGSSVRKGRAASFCSGDNVQGIATGVCLVVVLILFVFLISDFTNLLDFSFVDEMYEQGIDEFDDLIDKVELNMMKAVMWMKRVV